MFVVAILGIAFISHQRSVAHEARTQFDRYFTTTAEALDGYASLTDSLEQHAANTGYAMRIPQFPIVVPPTYFPMYFPYDAWVAVSKSTPPSGLVIASPGDLTLDESQAAAQFLDLLGLPQALNAAQAIRTVGPDIRNLIWLFEFATKKGMTIRLPDFTYVYPELELTFSLSQCLQSSFELPLNSLEVVPKNAVADEELRELSRLLKTSREPQAENWAAFINRLSSSPH